jgi:hypothetical protein
MRATIAVVVSRRIMCVVRGVVSVAVAVVGVTAVVGGGTVPLVVVVALRCALPTCW